MTSRGITYNEDHKFNKKQETIVKYETIRKKLQELEATKLASSPPITISFQYLLGMFCQLMAECHHDWNPI